MDKNKQFTQNAHQIGSMVHPEPSLAHAEPEIVEPTVPKDTTPKIKSLLEDADLTSDFDVGVDPDGMHDALPVAEPPAESHAEPSEPSSTAVADELKVASPVVAAAVSSAAPHVSSISRPAPMASVAGVPGKFKQIIQNPYARWGLAGFGVLVLMTASVFLGTRFASKSAQMIDSTAELDKSTLLIDSEKQTVGVKSTANPDGLQVGATATVTPQGSANIRMGLLEGKNPSLLFKDGQSNIWRITNTEGALEFIQGTEGRAKLDSNALSLANALNIGGQTNANGGLNVSGNTSLGKDGNSLLTVQGNKVAIPNSLNFDENTLVLNAANNNVAVGAASAGAYKLLVAGTIKANSSIITDGQVLAAPGSAKGPSYTFTNNGSSGLFLPSINAVGITAGGTEVLRVQQGSVIAIGANLEADGFVRAGRSGGSPAFQVLRYTGALDGSGGAAVATGISSGYSRVLTVQAWYRGNSNEAMPMSVDYVNGGDFRISGGIPGRQYRATLIYSQDGAGW